MAEHLAPELIQHHFPRRFEELPPAIFLEHYVEERTPEGRLGRKATWDRLSFHSWAPRRVWLSGQERVAFGEPQWAHPPEHDVAPTAYSRWLFSSTRHAADRSVREFTAEGLGEDSLRAARNSVSDSIDACELRVGKFEQSRRLSHDLALLLDRRYWNGESANLACAQGVETRRSDGKLRDLLSTNW